MCVETLKKKGPDVFAFTSVITGLAGVRAAAKHDTWRKALELDSESRVVVIGTEGAADPAIYDRLVGPAPDFEKQLERA